jgi:hypothetical protein
MTQAAARHRELDRRAAQAMGEPPGHALVRSRDRMKDLKSMQTPQARVLLADLTECVSGRGNRYLKGWLGASSLVAFAGDPDAEGRPTWKLYLTERASRQDGVPAAHRRPSRADAASASTEPPASPGARPGSSYRVPRPESARAQRERVAGEILRDYGDEELNDAVPF